MITAAVLAPFASAIIAALFSARTARRTARMLLGLVSIALTVAATRELDVLSSIFALIVTVVGILATLFSTSIFPRKGEHGDFVAQWTSRPAYFLLMGAFVSSMLFTVTRSTFTGLWIGISATTLATTFLVGFTGGKAALEAAWKYLVLCSFGIAIALIGLLMLGRTAMLAGIAPVDALSWQTLAAHATLLGNPLTRTALLLMVLGFATKAGLAPMHAWLPDAHSKAPAPVSALLSGLLVSCALYAIMRVQSVAMLTIPRELSAMFLILGTLSLLVATTLMLVQRDAKRFLSYSTIEHAGLVAIALGTATPLGAFAALYHVLNHTFAKSAAFFSIGIVQHTRGTVSLSSLRGLWNERAGKPFLAALLGLAGLPPFATFLSELLIIIALVQVHQWFVLAAVILGLNLGFAALARLAIESESGPPVVKPAVVPRTALAIAYGSMFVALALIAVPFLPFAPALYAIGANAGGH